ncbi:flagellar biosynthesis regulator FlaF [Nitrospirillum iridis]|uniref:Flagellar protein FlaF n=1 Tax=Nitrospirillum iridis TaxID=765888 RepID=A0A7X0AW37_9PROT|nr:flagellar biosynthesis regulator FlaF [Nitrospirillum iridis]MBB6251168.1 flagellar protein FlaF [Nitrospirillum iridis]
MPVKVEGGNGAVAVPATRKRVSQGSRDLMKPSAGYSNRPASDNPRDVEAWGLTEAARRLLQAQQTPNDPEPMRQALSLNQRLWTIFQSSMAEPDCPLPKDLREKILVLSLIVDRQTFERLGDLDATKLDSLIDINRNIAAGLSQRPSDATNAAAPAMPVGAPRPPGMAQPTGAAPAAPRPGMAPGMAAGGVGKFNISI